MNGSQERMATVAALVEKELGQMQDQKDKKERMK